MPLTADDMWEEPGRKAPLGDLPTEEQLPCLSDSGHELAKVAPSSGQNMCQPKAQAII